MKVFIVIILKLAEEIHIIMRKLTGNLQKLSR